MERLNNAKLITCILPKGKAIPLLEALNKKGHQKINFAFARGSDIDSPTAKKGMPEEVEKEIVTIVADNASQGEELFDLAYSIAEMNQPGGGMIYMSSLGYTTSYKAEV